MTGFSKEDHYTEQNIVQEIFKTSSIAQELFLLLSPIQKELVLGIANVAFIQGQKDGLREAKELLLQSRLG